MVCGFSLQSSRHINPVQSVLGVRSHLVVRSVPRRERCIPSPRRGCVHPVETPVLACAPAPLWHY